MKQNLILIQADSSLIRAGILKKGELSDFFAEGFDKRSQVGAVYKARVIQKRLGSCFVDLGRGQSAFLSPTNSEKGKGTDLGTFPSSRVHKKLENSNKHSINIRTGQYLMVQVIKDSLGNKNLRVSQKISLPSAHLVYLPQDLDPHIGISRQIEEPSLREKLIHSFQKEKGQGSWIIRTKVGSTMALKAKSKSDSASKAVSVLLKILKKEAEELKELYLNLLKKYRSQTGAGLVYSPPGFGSRLIRDFLTEDIQQVLVNNKHLFLEIKSFAKAYIPEEAHKLQLYQAKKLSLFDKYDLETEITKLLQKKIKLPKGGFIILEETEAAVVVDVNSGNFKMGKKSIEENILKINILAAQEIARQIRLRNCGGIVLIDFIDMEKEKSRQKLMDELAFQLKKDRAPTNLFPLSEISIAQITRKRERPSLKDVLCQPCPHCAGLGHTF